MWPETAGYPDLEPGPGYRGTRLPVSGFFQRRKEQYQYRTFHLIRENPADPGSDAKERIPGIIEAAESGNLGERACDLSLIEKISYKLNFISVCKLVIREVE